MDFSSKVNDMFDDGILNVDDLHELNALRRDAKAAICVSEDEFKKVAGEVTKEAGDWSDNTFCSVARILDRCSESIEMDKTAGPKGKVVTEGGRHLQNLMTMIGVGSLAAIPATRAIEHISMYKNIDNSWEHLIKTNPEMAHNPNTARNWSVLEDFAPDIAANRHAATSLIGTMNEYGAVSPKLIADLISMQKGIDSGKPGFGGPLDPTGAAKVVGGLIPTE